MNKLKLKPIVVLAAVFALCFSLVPEAALAAEKGDNFRDRFVLTERQTTDYGKKSLKSEKDIRADQTTPVFLDFGRGHEDDAQTYFEEVSSVNARVTALQRQ